MHQWHQANLLESNIPWLFRIKSKESASAQTMPPELINSQEEDDKLVKAMYPFIEAGAYLQQNYIDCPLPYSDITLCVYTHEWGHAVDPEGLERLQLIHAGFSSEDASVIQTADMNNSIHERQANARALVRYKKILKDLGDDSFSYYNKLNQSRLFLKRQLVLKKLIPNFNRSGLPELFLKDKNTDQKELSIVSSAYKKLEALS